MAEMQIAVRRRREAENGWARNPRLSSPAKIQYHLSQALCDRPTIIVAGSPWHDATRMTHFLHTEADLQAGLAQLIARRSAAQAGRGQGRRLQPAPPRSWLCRPVRHRLRPAALDRGSRGNPHPAVRRLRSVSSRHGAAGARRQAQAARPLGGQDQIDQGDRQSRRQRATSISTPSATWMPTRRTPRSPRCTASGPGPPTFICCSASAMPMRFPSRRPRGSGIRPHRLRLAQAAGRQALTKIAEAWRPWRGVAAHLLWAYYHAVKKRDVVPVQPAKNKEHKRGNG